MHVSEGDKAINSVYNEDATRDSPVSAARKAQEKSKRQDRRNVTPALQKGEEEEKI